MLYFFILPAALLVGLCVVLFFALFINNVKETK